MKPEDLTTDDLNQCVRRALVAAYGENAWVYPITLKPLASPMMVFFNHGGDTFRRAFTVEVAGDLPSAVLGDESAEVEGHTVYLDLPDDGDGDGFSFSASTVPGRVEWTGTVFREGDYGPKGIYTRTDIDALAATFPAEGVEVRDTHRKDHEKGFLDRLIEAEGTKVARVWSTDDPAGKRILEGTFDAPSWLDQGVKSANLTKKVSIGLTPQRDRIKEISLVLNPHVEDAAVFEREIAVAFSRSANFPTFAASHPSDAQRIATAAATAPTPATEDMDRPTFNQRLSAFFAGKTPEQRAALTEAQIAEAVFAQTTPTPVQTSAPNPLYAGVNPDLVRQIEETKRNQDAMAATFAADRDANDGAKFYLEQLRAGKADPADEGAILADFGNARFRDRHTEANFSAETGGAAEKALRERYAAMPARRRIGAQAIDSGAAPTFSGDGLGVWTKNEKGELV